MGDALLIGAGGAGAGLLHADLHNHTLLSDGDGDAEAAFASMRAAGLDVAAVTDHAYGPCEPQKTIDEAGWRRLGKLADAADEAGAFVAVRGFEWSSTVLGHMNVWGGERWTEPLQYRAAAPTMAAFYEWLAAGDELAGFNHPGRETGRFGLFRFDPRLARRMVALEMFNRDEDYLFEGVDDGSVSPLVACLAAGWRPGLVGVTDEHRGGWGFHEGLGRTGIWSRSRTRAGLREAMLARRMFATRERGLRIDATLDGVAMGGAAAAGRTADVRLMLQAPPEWQGHRLTLQVLQHGEPLPAVTAEADFRVGEVVALRTPIQETGWVVLRVVDHGRPGDPRAGGDLGGRSVAYCSPFFTAPGG